MNNEENKKRNTQKKEIKQKTSRKLTIDFYNPIIVDKYIKFDRTKIYNADKR